MKERISELTDEHQSTVADLKQRHARELKDLSEKHADEKCHFQTELESLTERMLTTSASQGSGVQADLLMDKAAEQLQQMRAD